MNPFHMRIAMIGQKGIPAKDGGVERHVHDLAMRLGERGFDVTVYSRKWYTGGETLQLKNVHNLHIPTIHTKHLDTILHTFLATIHALYHRADVIHYHGVGPSLLSWIPRILSPHIKVVTTFHSMDRKHQKWGWFAKLMLRVGEFTACKFAHSMIAVSPTIEQYVRDVYDKKATYVPNAIYVNEVSTKHELLQPWNLVPKQYLVMVSRLIPHKGAHYLLEAWKQLQKEKSALVANKKLVIVGDGYYTDEYVASLKRLAGTDASIVFTGFQNGETLRAIFSNALFQVHPSDNEGLPICVLEGMGYGLPILLSNIPEHRDLNGDPDSLFQYSSVPALTEKLTLLLSLSTEELMKKGKSNRDIIDRYYTWDRVIGNIIDVYEPLTAIPLQKRMVSV